MIVIKFSDLRKLGSVFDGIDKLIDAVEKDKRPRLEKALQAVYNDALSEFEELYPYEISDYKRLKRNGKNPKDDLLRENQNQRPFYYDQLIITALTGLSFQQLPEAKHIAGQLRKLCEKNENILWTEAALEEFVERFLRGIALNDDGREISEHFQLDRIEEKLEDLKHTFNNTEVKVPRPIGVLKSLETFFVGREEELREIRRLLRQGKSVLLFKGYGGIGKTTLALEYVHRYGIADFEYIIWATFDGSLSSSLATDEIATALGVTGGKDFTNQVLMRIKSLTAQAKVLVVLDNFYLPPKESDQAQLLRELRAFLPEATKLLTSRQDPRVDWITKKEIGKLPPDDAYRMFAGYCACQPEQAEFEELYSTVDGHTLTLELSAKLIAEYKGEVSLTDIIAKFKDINAKLDIDEAEVTTNYTASQLRIDSYLDVLFDLSNLQQEEIALLRKFAVLPPEFMLYEDFKELLAGGKAIKFRKTLNSLSDHGWLQKSEAKETVLFLCPPVIQNFVKQKYPSAYNYYKDLVEKLIDLHYIEPGDNPVDKFRWLPYGSSVVEALKEEQNAKIATLANNVSLIYKAKGELDKALEFALMANEILKQTVGENHPDLATSYNNIATVYQDKGELDKALEFAFKALVIRKQVLDKKHPDLATSYNNIAMIYQNKGELGKALEFALKANEIWRQVLGENHPSLATSYNNIALIYIDKSELDKALEFALKALIIGEQVLGKNHPSLATSYNNVAMIYSAKGDLGKALEFALKANEILKQSVGENHPNLATCYNNIARIYYDLGDKQQAWAYISRAAEIFEKTLGSEHPHTKAAKEFREKLEKELRGK